MLNNIINLTKVFFKTSFNKSSKSKNKIVRVLLLILLFAYLTSAFGFLSYEIIMGLKALNQEEAFLGLIFMAVITLTLFTTIVSTINVLYFSQDNQYVLPLPVRPLEILSAKLNTVLAYIYFEEAMFGLLPLIMYGVLTNQSLIYYPLMIIVLLALPIIPLLIAALIVIVLMAITKGIRNKNIVQVITMIISIVFALTISMFSSSMSNYDPTLLLDKAGSLVEIYKKTFITMPLALSAITDFNLISLLILIVVSIASYILVCCLAQKLYYRGMLGSLYSSAGVSDKKITDDSYKSKGLALSYVLKEFKIYFRRPTFFVQLILPCLLLPAFTIGMSYYGMISEAGIQVLDGLKLIYSNKQYSTYVYAVFLLAAMFSLMYCMISLVAVSKDGHDAYAMKYLPAPFYKQVIYKMLPDILVCLFCYVVISMLAHILFKLPINYILMSLPVMFLFSILHGFLILTDLRKPKLDWLNEIHITKRNLRTLFGIVFSFVNMGIVAALSFLLKIDALVIMLIMTNVYVVLVVLLYNYVKNRDIRLADGF